MQAIELRQYNEIGGKEEKIVYKIYQRKVRKHENIRIKFSSFLFILRTFTTNSTDHAQDYILNHLISWILL